MIYASDYGHTRAAAAEVTTGARTVRGVEVRSLDVDETSTRDIGGADGIVIGTPVHMGSAHWRIKRFIDERLGPLWTEGTFAGRVGAVFATGGGYGNAGAGCELAMLSVLSLLAELGALIVPLPRHAEAYRAGGLHWGPYARCANDHRQQIELPDPVCPLFRAHGVNVARTASLISRTPERSAFGVGPLTPTARSSS